MNSFKRFNEDKLPNKSKFFSSLKDCGINEKEYERTIKIWEVFKIKNLGEYYDLYLKTDVSSLVDVFEKFVETCLEYYKLDPSNYFSAPGLSFDTILKMAKVKLERIHDINVYLIFEKGVKGGISCTSKRHSKIIGGKTIMY